MRKWVARVIVGLSAVSALLLGLNRLSWPTATFWTDHVALLVGAVILAGATPITQRALAEYGENQRLRELDLAEKIRTYLNAAFVQIQLHTKADLTRIGVQAFLVRGKFRPSIPARRWFLREQKRIVRVKLDEAEAPSGITWTRGKGMIGRCWADHGPHYVNLAEEFEQYRGLTATDWSSLGERERYGLSFEEFSRTRDRYGLIAVVPIMHWRNDKKYLGCVSFDTPPGCPTPEDWRPIYTPLGIAAQTISTLY